MSESKEMADSDLESDFLEEDKGEIAILLESLEDINDSAPLTENIERALRKSIANLGNLVAGVGSDDSSAPRQDPGQVHKSLSLESAYGHPLSVQEATRRVPPGEGGLLWHALLINGDPFTADGKLKEGLNERDFDLANRTIKPRRASLPVLAQDFFSSLTRLDDNRYIFHGVLNGWPSLQTFAVRGIQRRRQKREFFRPKELLSGQRLWAHMWSADKEGKQGVHPSDAIQASDDLIFRISFRGPPWSSRGWSQESPGFAFWYQARLEQPKLTYGTQMVQDVDPTPVVTNLHMISHRYARKKENPKDMLTYHSIVLLEWDHGEYTTVIEAAYLNGLAGFRGKSNFFDDLQEPITQMYKCFPPEMVCPWLTNAAEIRAFDVAAKSLSEFKDWMHQYEGHEGRFVDIQFHFSHPARLYHRSKKDIAQYLVNYIRRDVTYSELTRNCQTLAADLCAFLAGKKEVLPYHPVNRIEYKNRSYLFLYDPDMYEQSQPSSLQANQLKR